MLVLAFGIDGFALWQMPHPWRQEHPVILSPLFVCWHSDPFCTLIREGLGTCRRIPQSPYQQVAIHFCGWEAQAGGQSSKFLDFGCLQWQWQQ